MNIYIFTVYVPYFVIFVCICQITYWVLLRRWLVTHTLTGVLNQWLSNQCVCFLNYYLADILQNGKKYKFVLKCCFNVGEDFIKYVYLL